MTCAKLHDLWMRQFAGRFARSFLGTTWEETRDRSECTDTERIPMKQLHVFCEVCKRLVPFENTIPRKRPFTFQCKEHS